MTRTAVVYPRGFLGFDIGLPVQKAPAPSMQTMVLAMRKNDPINDTSPQPYIANSEIDSLWDLYKSDSDKARNFEFTERVIKLALKCFGTTNIASWFEIQPKSQFFDDLHRRYLIDTLQFVCTGKRSLSVGSWKSMLLPRRKDTSDTGVYDITMYFDIPELPRVNSFANFNISVELSEFICLWISRPDGLADMLCSLSILFGKLESIR